MKKEDALRMADTIARVDAKDYVAKQRETKLAESASYGSREAYEAIAKAQQFQRLEAEPQVREQQETNRRLDKLNALIEAHYAAAGGVAPVP